MCDDEIQREVSTWRLDGQTNQQNNIHDCNSHSANTAPYARSGTHTLVATTSVLQPCSAGLRLEPEQRSGGVPEDIRPVGLRDLGVVDPRAGQTHDLLLVGLDPKFIC